MLPNLRLHNHLPRGSHKLHPCPFSPRELQLQGEGGLHTQHPHSCDGGGVSRVPGGTRLSIGLSHDCSLGGWMGSLGGETSGALLEGMSSWGGKWTRRAVPPGGGGWWGAIGHHSRAKLRLRTAQPRGVTFPKVQRLPYKNSDRGRAKRITTFNNPAKIVRSSKTGSK